MSARNITSVDTKRPAVMGDLHRGYEVILVPDNIPVASRRPGALSGQIQIAPDFDQLPYDIAEAFGTKTLATE